MRSEQQRQIYQHPSSDESQPTQSPTKYDMRKKILPRIHQMYILELFFVTGDLLHAKTELLRLENMKWQNTSNFIDAEIVHSAASVFYVNEISPRC